MISKSYFTRKILRALKKPSQFKNCKVRKKSLYCLPGRFEKIQGISKESLSQICIQWHNRYCRFVKRNAGITMSNITNTRNDILVPTAALLSANLITASGLILV